MSISPDAQSILRTIARLIDIDDLAFDDQGFCLLELADEIPVALKNDATHCRVHLVAELGRVEDPGVAFLQTISEWNLQRLEQPCPWVAWDAENSRVAMGEEISYGEDDPMVERKFEAFMESLLTGRGFLSEIPNDSGAPGELLDPTRFF